ncbi:hypothetical protein GCM10011499_08450 [Pelagibacterium lentulum]|uniref:Uncharacterized protein n=1 Tax=Pelagibacterium lentulum TaxID=2029865 RepID=A0A916R6H7_9HYPH|nr:hypothetical protein GCM10011499_08450 [Pelagibacterium lentulum]
MRCQFPLLWWDTPAPGNFGDWLLPYVVGKVSGRPIHYVKSDHANAQPHYIGVNPVSLVA